MWVLVKNSNVEKFAKFLKKIFKTSMLNLSDEVEGYMINIHIQIFFWKRIKLEDFMNKTN